MQELNLALIAGLVIKLYAMLTPTAILTAFIDYTRSESRIDQYLVAVKTGLAIYISGQFLLLFGAKLFDIFGFTLDAFRIGVGLLLFLEAIDLMRGDRGTPRVRQGTDISVVPLAIPLGMGPSTIGAIMVLGATSTSIKQMIAVSGCLFLSALGVTVLLCLAGPTQRLLHRTGLLVMSKLTALLIAAIAAQVIFTGVRAFLRHAHG